MIAALISQTNCDTFILIIALTLYCRRNGKFKWKIGFVLTEKM